MKTKLWELLLMILFGGVMFTSMLLMKWLPNIHLIAMLITLFTILFRSKALIAIYTFVFITGIYAGFAPWWIPYIYIWTVLWAVVMILPKNMPNKVAAVVYMVVCGLHGFLFGLLYAPFQAIYFGMSAEAMKTWLIMNIPFDLVHGISNICVATVIIPLYIPLKKAISKLK